MSEERIAPIGKRFLAFLIDEVLITIYFSIIFWNQISAIKSYAVLNQFINENILVLFLLKIVYHTFFIGFNGMTIGKYLLGIKVVNLDNGERVSYGKAFIRSIFRLANEMFFYIGFWFAFFSPLKQTLHDYTTNTVVIDA